MLVGIVWHITQPSGWKGYHWLMWCGNSWFQNENDTCCCWCWCSSHYHYNTHWYYILHDAWYMLQHNYKTLHHTAPQHTTLHSTTPMALTHVCIDSVRHNTPITTIGWPYYISHYIYNNYHHTTTHGNTLCRATSHCQNIHNHYTTHIYLRHNIYA